MIDYDNNYPFIVQQVMEYIQSVKSEDQEIALVDIILDFCVKNGLEVELVGDAISSDEYFKSFIEKDCKVHRYLPGDEQLIEEW